MLKKIKPLHIGILVVILVLMIDQIVKIWVKTNMYMWEEHHLIGNFFVLHFTENNGMAFGMEFGGNIGKLALSIFRILAIFGIGYYMYRLTKKNSPRGLIICIALIMAGALGNIIDSAFYGMIFSFSIVNNLPVVAEIFS